MARKCGLGFFPTNGLVMTGQKDQTARIERSGAYNATTGTTLGTRAVAQRVYDSFSAVTGGTAFTPGTTARFAFDSGHVVIWSCSGNGTTSSPFYTQVTSGQYDTALKNTFARIEALPWGTAVTPISTSSGSKEIIPGSQYGGTKPTEMIWLQNHEPNINNGATRGSAHQFAGMMKYIAQLYDSWCAANGITTKHIKFAVCLSNPTGTTNVNAVASGSDWSDTVGSTGYNHNFYGVGTSNDISKTGARPMDYAGWDIYYPRTENSGQGPVTASDEIGFAATSKYGACRAWTAANMPTNTMDVLPEFAIRIPTSPASGGAGPDPTWPATWYTGMISYLNSNTLPNGNHPVAYACQYAAASVLADKVQGGADNSIIPDQTTQATSYQVGGVSLRPAFTAFHDALITLGNPSLTAGSPGVTPTGVSATTPTAGQTSATLSWTLNAANVSYNVYKDGVKTQSGVTSGSATVYASAGALPQTHSYTVTGIGTDGSETAASSSVSVTYPASTSTPPATPTGLTISSVGQTTATASCTAVSGSTGYSWVVDGGTPVTSSGPSIQLTGLSSGTSHSVTVAAYNSGGQSAASSAVSFSTSSGPDTTAPTVPASVTATLAGDGTVVLSWAPSTDPPTAGQTVSGMGTYVVQRSLSPIAGSGTTISPPGLSVAGFIDANPPSSPTGITQVYYTVQAIDIALNPSGFSSPVEVDIPASSGQTKPTAVLSIPATLTFGQLFVADGSQSTPGTGGAIVSWQFDFGDAPTSPPALAVSSARHAYQQPTLISPREYKVTLTVTDASGLQGKTTATVIAAPGGVAGSADGLTWDYSGADMFVSQSDMTADVFNGVAGSHESSLASLDQRVGLNENALAQIGDPLTPRRHGGCLYASINPESAGGYISLNATTLYVVRCMTINGEQFGTVRWVQVAASPSAVTGAFWAVYDVAGNLMSPSTVSDASSSWATQDEQSFALDGGPFDPPFGADATDPSTTAPTNEFFLAFWFGTVGATKPQMAVGSQYANAVNMGTSKTAVTPSQATIQQVPIFSTASNAPSAALTPPTTLGTLTRLGASLLLGLYP